MELAATVVGWILICGAILAMFVRDEKMNEVPGEKKMLEEKRARIEQYERFSIKNDNT